MKKLYSVILLWLLVTTSWAQDVYYEPGRVFLPGTYEFHLKDGTRLRGQVVRNDSATFLVRTRENVDQTLRINDLIRADLIGGTFRHVPSYQNGFPFRMLFSQTALPLERRRIYYQNSCVIVSRVDIGLTRNWSIGGGLHNLRPNDFYTLSTKISTRLRPRMHLAVSAQYINIRVTESLFNRLGLVQGLVTVGEAQRNLTVGAGVTISQYGHVSSGVVTIGYVRKIAPDLTLISQNHVLVGEVVDPRFVYLSGLSTAGLRFDRHRHAFDIAALMPVYSLNRRLFASVLPYVSYQVRFGK